MTWTCFWTIYIGSSSRVFFESHSAGTIDLSVAIQMAVTARFYERIGDHAVNVAHFVCYLITGEIPPAGDHRRGGRIGDADSNFEGLTS